MTAAGQPTLATLLAATLRRLENTAEFSAADSTVQELKASIVRSLAELEVQKSMRELPKAS